MEGWRVEGKGYYSGKECMEQSEDGKYKQQGLFSALIRVWNGGEENHGRGGREECDGGGVATEYGTICIDEFKVSRLS